MKIRILSLVLAGCLLGLAGCSAAPVTDEIQEPAVGPARIEEDEGYSVEFSFDSFDQDFLQFLRTNGYDDVNLLVSPMSLRSVMCLPTLGASGETQEQLLNGLGFDSVEDMTAWYQGWQEKAGQVTDEDNQLILANSLWNNESAQTSFNQTYLDQIQSAYGAQATTLPADELVEAANAWVQEQTGGLVSEVPVDVVSHSNVLLSTLYLKEAWVRQFDPNLTQEGIFFDMDGNEASMEFMTQTDSFLYADQDGTQILAMPLADGFHAIFFLGDRTDLLGKLSGLQTEQVCVKLPKLSMDMTVDNTLLMNFMMTRGVTDAFDWRNADFSGMGEGSWYLSDLRQGLKLDWDEGGLEAAAVTGVSVDTTSVKDESEVKEFTVNRPFAFCVVSGLQTDQQEVLFFGQFMRLP